MYKRSKLIALLICIFAIHLHAQNKHLNERNIIFRFNFSPQDTRYDQDPITYLIISTSKIDDLIRDTSLKTTSDLIYKITKLGGILASIENGMPTKLCCLCGDINYGYYKFFDSLVIHDSESIAKNNLESDFSVLKCKRKDAFRYITKNFKSYYSINFWMADLDYCICDHQMWYLPSSPKLIGEKIAFLTNIYNIHRLDNENREKIKSFFRNSLKTKLSSNIK